MMWHSNGTTVSNNSNNIHSRTRRRLRASRWGSTAARMTQHSGSRPPKRAHTKTLRLPERLAPAVGGTKIDFLGRKSESKQKKTSVVYPKGCMSVCSGKKNEWRRSGAPFALSAHPLRLWFIAFFDPICVVSTSILRFYPAGNCHGDAFFSVERGHSSRSSGGGAGGEVGGWCTSP